MKGCVPKNLSGRAVPVDMVRSTLLGHIPDGLRNRVPAGPGGLPDRPSVSVPSIGADSDDGDGSGRSRSGRLSRGLTLLSLAGLVAAAIGTIGRLLLDRRRSDDTTDVAERGGTSSGDGSSETGLDPSRTGPETEREPSVTDRSAAVASRDESSSGDADASPTGSFAVDAAEPDDPNIPEERSEGSSVVTGTVSTPVEKLSGVAGSDTHRGHAEREPPQIAPLVGMAALVGMRLVVEKLRERGRRDGQAR